MEVFSILLIIQFDMHLSDGIPGFGIGDVSVDPGILRRFCHHGNVMPLPIVLPEGGGALVVLIIIMDCRDLVCTRRDPDLVISVWPRFGGAILPVGIFPELYSGTRDSLTAHRIPYISVQESVVIQFGIVGGRFTPGYLHILVLPGVFPVLDVDPVCAGPDRYRVLPVTVGGGHVRNVPSVFTQPDPRKGDCRPCVQVGDRPLDGGIRLRVGAEGIDLAGVDHIEVVDDLEIVPPPGEFGKDDDTLVVGGGLGHDVTPAVLEPAGDVGLPGVVMVVGPEGNVVEVIVLPADEHEGSLNLPHSHGDVEGSAVDLRPFVEGLPCISAVLEVIEVQLPFAVRGPAVLDLPEAVIDFDVHVIPDLSPFHGMESDVVERVIFIIIQHCSIHLDGVILCHGRDGGEEQNDG